MKIEKESDTLKLEYRHLVHELERLTAKNHPYDHIIASQVHQKIFQRQNQIRKELEECTGVEITTKTKKDVLKENRTIQGFQE